MKLLGALMILFSGVCLGWKQADTLKKREEALLDLRQLIQQLRTGILYAGQPLCELIARNQESRFCFQAAADAHFFQDPKGALQSAGKSLLTERSDLELYCALVSGLGESDTQGQLEHLRLYEELLSVNLSQARESREKKSRLYLCLGAFSGTAVCLLLL